MVRCRSCEKCLRARAAAWAARAETERTAIAGRTWFFTLTFQPSWLHGEAMLTAKVASGGGCRKYDPLTGELRDFADGPIAAPSKSCASSLTESWRDYCPPTIISQVARRETTLWLKRLRKRGHELRYMMVEERHKSGAPHYHGLLHEQAGPIGKRALQASWGRGYSQWKLARNYRAAMYCAKYLTKEDGFPRQRASLRYGHGGLPVEASGSGEAAPCGHSPASTAGRECIAPP